MENIVEYIIGISFIIIGFIIERFPMLLSGYNSLSQKDREKIDTPNLIRSIRIISIRMGIIIILSAILLNIIGQPDLITGLTFIIISIGAILITLKQYAYTKHISKGKINKYTSYISLLIILIVISLCFYTAMPTRISINNNKLEIKGSYGLTIPLENVTKIEMVDKIPKSIIRTNGLSFWKYHKGKFRLENIGTVTLFLHTGKGPYLIVYSENEYPIIINRSTTNEITDLYNSILQ